MEVQKIYFDMDGVLADFDRGVAELCKMVPEPVNREQNDAYDDRMWAEIRKIDHYYDRLALMPGAKELFDAVRGKYGSRCEILTGIPQPRRGVPEAGEDKIRWTRRNLSADITIHIVYRQEKLSYCTGPGTILIDDLEKTIREWNDAGGTGILHVSAEDTFRKLKGMGIL